MDLKTPSIFLFHARADCLSPYMLHLRGQTMPSFRLKPRGYFMYVSSCYYEDCSQGHLAYDRGDHLVVVLAEFLCEFLDD